MEDHTYRVIGSRHMLPQCGRPKGMHRGDGAQYSSAAGRRLGEAGPVEARLIPSARTRNRMYEAETAASSERAAFSLNRELACFGEGGDQRGGLRICRQVWSGRRAWIPLK